MKMHQILLTLKYSIIMKKILLFVLALIWGLGSVQKIMENGVLYLMYNGTMYNVQGTRVK